MSEGSSPIRRRRRSTPQPIKDDERKTVTFLADAKTYNHLVKISQQTGRTIAELVEVHLNKTAEQRIRPTFEDVFFGSSYSMDVLRLYANVFSGLSGPNDWRDNELTRASIAAAINTVTDLVLSCEDENPDVSEPANTARRAALRNARAVGKLFGATLAGPFLGKILDMGEQEGGAPKKD